jgi:hypothetical protein
MPFDQKSVLTRLQELEDAAKSATTTDVSKFEADIAALKAEVGTAAKA